jgi:hypothetical protein
MQFSLCVSPFRCLLASQSPSSLPQSGGFIHLLGHPVRLANCIVCPTMCGQMEDPFPLLTKEEGPYYNWVQTCNLEVTVGTQRSTIFNYSFWIMSYLVQVI